MGWGGYESYEASIRKGCFSRAADIIDLDLASASPTSLKFIAMGDTGTGDPAQKKIAQAVQQVCDQAGCDFVLLLGDNFYPNGVSSINDPLFETVFENVYASIEKPFLTVLGNHDVRENALPQIQYSLKSSKWRMPNYSYHFALGPARFFALNSSCHLFSFEDLQNQFDAQPSSLENPSPWTFVFSHHPVYSSGTHGDSDLLMQWYWQQFLQESVDFYLAGHDHELEHLQQSGESTEYIVSGAGGKHYRSSKEKEKTSPSQIDSKFIYQDTGFAWFEVDKTQVQMKFFNADGQPIYEFTKKKK